MKQMKQSTRILLLCIALLLGCAMFGTAIVLQKKANAEVIPEAGSSANADRPLQHLSWEGKYCPVKRRISTLLVLGTDDIEGRYEKGPEDVTMFYNDVLSDLLLVLVFDEDAKTVTPLQINRDTMCDVFWLSVNGKVGGTVTEQIALAHTYGSGGQDSCENTSNTVSRLLFDAPIDHYISFTMDAVPLMNDLVGGVTLTLAEDAVEIDPDYQAGTTITLKGKDALRFVRYRDTALLDSNLPRMNRQRLYLQSFLPAARASLAANSDLVIDAFKVLDPYLCMDMTVNDLSAYVERLAEYEILPVLTADGQYEMGENVAEFYVDKGELFACAVKAFCLEDQ